MELVNFPRVCAPGFCHHQIFSPRWRRSAAVITGKQSKTRGTQVGYYASKRRSTYKIADIEGDRPSSLVGCTIARRIQASEHVRGHVETVGPDAHLWIIRQIGTGRIVGPDCVAPPASIDRITRFRNGNALVVRTILNIGPREISHDKAIEIGRA